MEKPLGQGHGFFDECSFADFVVGPCNKDAFDTCLQVAEQPGKVCNPLVILSPHSGNGASHLTAAIGNTVAQRSVAPVWMLTTETFANGYLSALSKNESGAYLKKFRDGGAFLLDGVGFLPSKPKCADALIALLGALVDAGRQVVINGFPSSDLPVGLCDLMNRGKTVPLCEPSFEVKREAVRRAFALYGHDASDDVLETIAALEIKSIRALQGAVTRAFAFAQISSSSISSSEIVKKVLSDVLSTSLSPA